MNHPAVTRRGFLHATGLTAAGLALASCAREPGRDEAGDKGPAITFTQPATKLSGTLTLLMWSHFVPTHDVWFKGFAEDWGKRAGVTVRVDHISATELPTRISAEMQARQGHDLVQNIFPLSAYEPSVLNLSDLTQEAERRWGKQLDLCRKSSFNPKTNKVYGYSPGWAPDPGNYRRSLWQAAGMPDGPTTWDELLEAGARIKANGVRMGLGLSKEVDSNMFARALLWSFGAYEQDENERVTLNSAETVAAVEYVTKLYKQTMTNEVFSWNPASNNQGLVKGDLSYIVNSISAYRTAQGQNPEVADDIFFVAALRGTETALAAQHVMYNWVVPNHSKNPDAAKEFLLHYTQNWAAVCYHSQLYDFPAFPTVVPQLNSWLDNDPFQSKPANKLSLLKNAVDWSANLGFPGPASPAIGEVFGNFVLPTMFARAARGETSPKQAVADADKEVEQIFARWRARGLVGG